MRDRGFMEFAQNKIKQPNGPARLRSIEKNDSQALTCTTHHGYCRLLYGERKTIVKQSIYVDMCIATS